MSVLLFYALKERRFPNLLEELPVPAASVDDGLLCLRECLLPGALDVVDVARRQADICAEYNTEGYLASEEQPAQNTERASYR
eukprot:COSAG03_NODE_386_length_8314_cov_5.931589_6_plen_83_part_00